jgi:hypothetical protein
MQHPKRRHVALFGGFAAALAIVLLEPSGAQAAGNYDFCSTVVVRPDQSYRDPATCASSYSDAEIAAGAESVWIGDFTDVAHPVVAAPPGTCRPSPSHAANAAYVQRLKTARAAAGGPPLWIVHMHRFDLVPYTFAALPPFRSSYLLRTTRPFSQVTGFFANDRSSACLTVPCRWSDSFGGMEGKDVGTRLRDYIDKSGGANSYQSAVYYLARPDSTNVYWPTAALANLQDPAYRAWRVSEAKAGLQIGGYSVIDLNHKISQYFYGPHSIGSVGLPDVAAVKATADTQWSAQPSAYGYPEYMQGLVGLSRDLRAAGVPYSFTIALRAWSTDSFDDKTTTGVNEAVLLREIMTGARVVFLDREINATPAAMVDTAVADLAKKGVTAIPIDQECGIRLSQALPPPQAPFVTR